MKDKVDVSMEKVFIHKANKDVSTENQGGGKIMSSGKYKSSEKSNEVKKSSYSQKEVRPKGY